MRTQAIVESEVTKSPHTLDRRKHTRRLPPIITRKERWGLSWIGWTIVLTSMGVLLFSLLLTIYPFLCVTQRVGDAELVVEGWVHSYAIRAAVKEFKDGSYQRVFSTGGPVIGTGGYINDFNTSASVGAENLKAAGVPVQLIQMVPSRVSGRDRTYSSAVALRNWLREHDIQVHSMNVVTESVHARRTRLLFDRAFDGTVTVGIIAVENPDYDPAHWWRYSEGVKDVVSETVAYMYAKLLFHPSESSRGEKALTANLGQSK